MKEINHRNTIENYEKSLLKANLYNAQHRKILIGTFIGLLLFIILLVIICIQNRKLTHNNKQLFLKNKQLMQISKPEDNKLYQDNTGAKSLLHPLSTSPEDSVSNFIETTDSNISTPFSSADNNIHITDDEKDRIRRDIQRFF